MKNTANNLKKLFLIFSFAALIFTGCKGNADSTENETGKNTPPVVNPDKTLRDDMSSIEFANAMTVGWNLGNTLDADKGETDWGMPVTTKAMIKEVHKKGFNTIRIPISWHAHVSGSDYKIDSTWMDRVNEIVDWAYEDGMFIIINIHHDNYAPSEFNSKKGFSLSDDAAIQTKSKKYIEEIWKQIATRFANYDNHLVFEVLNEPRDINGEVTGNEWGCSGVSGKKICNIITAYEQVAVDTIRSISGNEKRFIMVPGYAASASDINMLNCYTMPTDTAKDRLLLSGHAYTPYPFAMKDIKDTTFDTEDKNILDDMFLKLKTKYIDKGIGIVMGEASASDKNNTAERIKWAEYYFTKAKEIYIPVILWDNDVLYKNSHDAAESHGYFNRKELSWYFPELVDTMIKAAGSKEYNPDADEDINPFNEGLELLTEAFDMTSWRLNKVFSATTFQKASDSTKIKFTVEETTFTDDEGYNSLKLQDKWDTSETEKDATILNKGLLTGGTVSDGSLVPDLPGTMIYTPTPAEWAKIKQNGLIVYGYGFKITSIIVTNK